MNIELGDLTLSPFDKKGGALGAYRVFGNDLQKIIEELGLVPKFGNMSGFKKTSHEDTKPQRR